MPLTVHLRPIGADVGGALTERFLAAERGTALIVVPHEATAVELRHALANAAGGALLGDAVLSWDRFLLALADARRPRIDRTGVALFLRGLMAETKLAYFRAARPSMGIARQIAETILALKRNGVDARRLRVICETRGSWKEHDLLTLFERYETARGERGVVDQGDIAQLAMANIRKERAALANERTLLSIAGIDRFAPGQLDLIAALAKHASGMAIHIELARADDPDAPFAPLLSKTHEQLETIADEVIDEGGAVATPAALTVGQARSPRQEARAVAALLTSAPNEETLLVLRPGDPFVDLLLAEAEAAGLLADRLPEASAMAAPLLHDLLRPATVANWPERADIGAFAVGLRDALRGQQLRERWSSALAERGTGRPAIARSFSAIAALEATLAHLVTTAELLELPPIGREEFLRLLAEELAGPRATETTIERLLPARLLPYEAGLLLPASRIVIPRCVEGQIPRPSSERLFFSEADRLAVEPDPTIDAIFATTEERLAAEALCFEEFRRGAQELFATFAAVDEGGSELLPSPFLDGSGLPALLDPAPPTPAAAAAPEWEERLADLAAVETARANHDEALPGFQGRITEEGARALVRDRNTQRLFSPTTLERYARCPFLFFAEKVLGLKPQEEETPEIQPKDRGTIIHAILERFYERHGDAFRTAVLTRDARKRIEAIVDALLDEVLTEHAALVGRSAEGLRPFQRAAMRQMAWQVIRTELDGAAALPEPLFPRVNEWAFGERPEETLVVPVEGEAPARIGGRVDRVDADDAGARFVVVDYKTGRSVGSIGKGLREGTHLQLPLYVEAVRSFLLPQAEALGGLLIGVQQAEKKHGFVKKAYNGIAYDVGRARSAMDDEHWEEALAGALAATGRYVKAIRAGQFAPDATEACRSCDFAEVCRESVGR